MEFSLTVVADGGVVNPRRRGPLNANPEAAVSLNDAWPEITFRCADARGETNAHIGVFIDDNTVPWIVLDRRVDDKPDRRIAAMFAGSPMRIPAAVNRRPCASIVHCTSRYCAPSAIRMPISQVRCATVYATTP